MGLERVQHLHYICTTTHWHRTGISTLLVVSAFAQRGHVAQRFPPAARVRVGSTRLSRSLCKHVNIRNLKVAERPRLRYRPSVGVPETFGGYSCCVLRLTIFSSVK